MAGTAGADPHGLVAVSRAVVSAAAELAAAVGRTVVGDDRVPTARGNAYEAICADRARARARDEMDALVRSLLAARPRAEAGSRSPARETGPAPRVTQPAGRPAPRGTRQVARVAAGRHRTTLPRHTAVLASADTATLASAGTAARP